MRAAWLVAMAMVLPGCVPSEGCLGSVDRCDATLLDVTLAGAHNAFNAADSGYLLPNHDTGLAAQLAGGVRAFLIDTTEVDGEVVVCHGPCALGQQPLAEVASIFSSFLVDHPTEPLLWIVQDGAPAGATVAALEAGGLGDVLWHWPHGDGWPTFGAMARRGKNLLLTVETDAPGPATWTSFYARGFDTAYDFGSVDEMDCETLRGTPGHGAFLLNHWLSTPFPTRDGAAQVNTADALQARVDACIEAHGWIPNVVAVDFWEVGDVVEVADALTEARWGR